MKGFFSRGLVKFQAFVMIVANKLHNPFCFEIFQHQGRWRSARTEAEESMN
jgi:hypothetical protein